MAQIGEEVYFKDGPQGHAQKSFIAGETSRSWYMSSRLNPWWAGDKQKMAQHGLRYEKKSIMFIGKEEFELEQWASNNRNAIQREMWRVPADKLKKIAEIIGYQD